MPEWFHFFYDLLIEGGLSKSNSRIGNAIILFALTILLLSFIDFVIWKILRFISTKISSTTKSKFDDLAISHKLPRHLAHIPTLIIAYDLFEIILKDLPKVDNIALRILQIITIIVVLNIIKSLLQTVNTYLKTLPNFKDKPIDSYIQVIMIFAWIAGLTTIIALISGVKLAQVLAGLGAASAIILLIFRDSILGLVASIQVSSNDTVRIGDWITMKKFDADGEVIEISLATVKIRNFDHSITSIPTYALISDSFTNWRAMIESDGRRLKRSIFIRQQSVHFLSKEEINQLKQIQVLKPYLDQRIEKIDEFNEQRNIDLSVKLNGRNLTNLGAFRKYMEIYLKDHPAVNKDLTVMVRYLDPRENGIPFELYAFITDKRGVNFEYIASNIFDHTLASISYFNLEISETSFDSIQSS